MCDVSTWQNEGWHGHRLTQNVTGHAQVKMAELEVLPAGPARLAAGCAAFLPLPQAAQEHQ